MLIRVETICPPIPTRKFDVVAYDDDRHPDGPQGYGKNALEAIKDLFEQLDYEEHERAVEAEENGQFGVGA